MSEVRRSMSLDISAVDQSSRKVQCGCSGDVFRSDSPGGVEARVNAMINEWAPSESQIKVPVKPFAVHYNTGLAGLSRCDMTDITF